MVDKVVSDAIPFPVDEGLPNISDGDEPWGSGGHLMALSQAVDSGSYVRSDVELTFTGHDGSNDQVDVTGGIAYLDLSGETVSVQSTTGGTSAPSYDTDLPTVPAIMVECPTTTPDLPVQSGTLASVWLAYATDGTVSGVSAGDVYLRSDDATTPSAPPHPSVELGETNPDDSSADALANRYPSPEFHQTRTERLATASRGPEWVVYRSGGTWYADGPSSATGTAASDPATALQHAADNAGRLVYLASSVPSGDPITTTVTIPSGVSFVGPGLRGTATVYGSASPVFKMEGGGQFGNLWLRKDVGTSMGSGDAIVCGGMGRGSAIRNVTVTRTDGNGLVMNGCQQMGVYGLYFAACGNPSNDTGELRLDNHPSDGLETNAVNFYNIHSHGSSNPQGSFIQMRASNHTDNDHPRNIRVDGINLENGPSSAIPCIEVAGRNNHFENVRAQGLDDCSTVFQLQSPRARDMSFANLILIGGGHGFSNASSTAASSQSGVDWAPMVSNAIIDVPNQGVYLDSYNQTDTPLTLNGVYNPALNDATGNFITVTASQDAQPGVTLSTIDAGGEGINIQGARLHVSGVSNATWQAKSDDFGPRLITDDGSFPPTVRTATTDANGLAETNFTGEFELKNGTVFATTPRGDGTVVEGTSLEDTTANGDLNMVRANVVNVSDGTAAGSVSVTFTIVPRVP